MQVIDDPIDNFGRELRHHSRCNSGFVRRRDLYWRRGVKVEDGERSLRVTESFSSRCVDVCVTVFPMVGIFQGVVDE